MSENVKAQPELVAKLVCFSIVTRVIVVAGADYQAQVAAAKKQLVKDVQNSSDNAIGVDCVMDDQEDPYNPERDNPETIFENDLLDLNSKLNPSPPDGYTPEMFSIPATRLNNKELSERMIAAGHATPVRELPYYELPGNSNFRHLYQMNGLEYGAHQQPAGMTRLIADHQVATLMEFGSNNIIVTFDLNKLRGDKDVRTLLVLLNSVEGELVRYHELTKSGSNIFTRPEERQILQNIEHQYVSLRKYFL